MKIKHMMIALFIGLAVIPLIFFGLTNMYYYNEKLDSILENDLKVATSTQIKAIENFYEERQNDARIIIGYKVVDQLLRSRREGTAEETRVLRLRTEDLLQSRIRFNRFLESVTILDKSFIVAASSEHGAYGRLSTLKDLDPKYFGRNLAFSYVVETERDGDRKKIIAGVQEMYEDSELIGYIVLEINLDFFKEVRESASLFNNGTVYITDGRQQLVVAGDSVSSRDRFQLSQEERSDYNRAWEERDKSSKQGILKYKARGDRYLSCYSNIKDMDWTVISSINADEVMQTRESSIRLALWIVLVLLVLLFAVHRFISRYVARPIRGMIGKFRMIKETQDYSIRMEDVGTNEFGVISGEVNALLDEIEALLDTEKKKREKLKDKAERDPMTGLYNKEAMNRLLEQELLTARLQGESRACLFLDIDDFKSFNTNYGHMGGDRVLSFIAGKLVQYIPGTAGRQGGDEFIAFTNREISREEASETVKALLKTINKGVVIREGEKPVTIRCSIGVAVFEGEGIDARELIKRADEAMYAVKSESKNGCRIWEEAPGQD